MSARRSLSLAVAVALSLAPVLQAGRIDAGSVEIGGNLSLDFDGANGTTAAADLLGGYFIMDGVLVGGRIGAYNDDVFTMLSGFATLEQHFETDTPWLPYVGGSLGILNAQTDLVVDGKTKSDKNTAGAVGGVAGIKFFITETVALDLSLNILVATDDVFIANGAPENVDITIKGGLRVFLF